MKRASNEAALLAESEDSLVAGLLSSWLRRLKTGIGHSFSLPVKANCGFHEMAFSKCLCLAAHAIDSKSLVKPRSQFLFLLPCNPYCYGFKSTRLQCLACSYRHGAAFGVAVRPNRARDFHPASIFSTIPKSPRIKYIHGITNNTRTVLAINPNEVLMTRGINI